MDNASRWHGYRRLDFPFEGKTATLVFPEKPAPGRPWAEYTEYFGAFPDTALALLTRGYHLAGVENRHRWGCEEDYQRKRALTLYLREEYGLAAKSVFLGMSCGGLIAVQTAARYPDLVAALYLDAPVLNLLSCPLAMGEAKLDVMLRDECLAALGMTRSEMLSFRGQPVDCIPALIRAKIPVILVYGTADTTVPYAENGALLERAYRAARCPLVVFAKPGCAHHPHGLSDPTPVVDKLEEWLRGGG